MVMLFVPLLETPPLAVQLAVVISEFCCSMRLPAAISS